MLLQFEHNNHTPLLLSVRYVEDNLLEGGYGALQGAAGPLINGELIFCPVRYFDTPCTSGHEGPEAGTVHIARPIQYFLLLYAYRLQILPNGPREVLRRHAWIQS
jgi:hypothetical protein